MDFDHSKYIYLYTDVSGLWTSFSRWNLCNLRRTQSKNKLLKSSYHIKNSYEFFDFITNQTFEHDEVSVSFDVVSRFTKAPVDKIIGILGKRWDEISIHNT